jgi:peptidoglycan/LPS O-acetylase OafA/YrhL
MLKEVSGGLNMLLEYVYRVAKFIIWVLFGIVIVPAAMVSYLYFEKWKEYLTKL